MTDEAPVERPERGQPADGVPARDEPRAIVVIDPGSASERAVAVHDRLCVGRECTGIDASRRLLLADETVSRSHLEIVLDVANDRAVVIDRSTNGTRLNGTRIERSVPARLRPGDRIAVGGTQLEFRADGFDGTERSGAGRTALRVSPATMALVVGDIIGYSTISESAESTFVLRSLEPLYARLRQILTGHGGTLNAYAGDAIFAVWEDDGSGAAPTRALAFARAAHRHVVENAPSLGLRDADGAPIRMGWAVALGPVAVSTFPGGHLAVIGDTTNLVFRLSGVAARDGFSTILITDAVRAAVADPDVETGPVDVHVKGRAQAVTVYGARTAGAD